MNIHFTGIRNTSFILEKDDKTNKVNARYLNTMLTNNRDGHDKAEYNKLITKFPEFKNPLISNFANIACFSNKDYNVFRLNGVTVPETDKYLPIFSFIGKLTKKISNMPEEKFVNDKNYLDSEYLDYALLMDRPLPEALEFPYADYIDKLHEPKNIKKCADKISQQLEKTIIEYLA